MEQENEYAPVDVVEQEETTSEEVQEESHDDSITLSKAEYSKLKRQAIAYKANKETPKQEQTAGLSKEDIELTVLASQGINAELLNEMKVLAKLRGKSIIEMKDDPIILAMKEVKEKEEKARLAKLPASKGSGNVRQEKNFSTPLSKEEHRELWKAQFNK